MKFYTLRTNNAVWRDVCKFRWGKLDAFDLPKALFIDPIAKQITKHLTEVENICVNGESVYNSLSVVYDMPEWRESHLSRYVAENTFAIDNKGNYILYDMFPDLLVVRVLDTDVTIEEGGR